MTTTDGLGLTPAQQDFYGMPPTPHTHSPSSHVPRPTAPHTVPQAPTAPHTFTHEPSRKSTSSVRSKRTYIHTPPSSNSTLRPPLTKKDAKRILAEMKKEFAAKDDPSGLSTQMGDLVIERTLPRHAEAAMLPDFLEENPGFFEKMLEGVKTLFGASKPQEETIAPSYDTAKAGVIAAIARFKGLEFNPETIKRDKITYTALSNFAHSTIGEALYDTGDAANDYITAFKPKFGSSGDERAIAQEQLFQDMYKAAFSRIRGFRLPANIY